MSISKTNLAYIAGFVDGEGCFTTTGNLAHQSYYLPTVIIGQKHPNILHYIQRVLGFGHVHSDNRGLYYPRIANKADVIKFIKLVSPYLRVKRKQSDIALKMANLVTPKTGIKLPKENLNKRIKLAKKLSKLKKMDYTRT